LRRLTCVYDGTVALPEEPYCRGHEAMSRYVEFLYDDDGLLIEVRDHRGGTDAAPDQPHLAFDYAAFESQSGDAPWEGSVLQAVTDLNGKTWRFEYDDEIEKPGDP